MGFPVLWVGSESRMVRLIRGEKLSGPDTSRPYPKMASQDGASSGSRFNPMFMPKALGGSLLSRVDM